MTEAPKNYLSWTQLNLIEKSLFQYVKYYILGDEFPQTPEIIFGKKIAKAIELDDEDDVDFLKIKHLLPVFPKKEFELTANICDIPIYGKLDGFDEKNLIIYEVKTGKNEWDYERVKNHGQLDFYSLLVFLNYNQLPSSVQLFWIPTERVNNDEIKIIGDVYKFEIKKDMSDLLKIGIRIKNAWEKN